MSITVAPKDPPDLKFALLYLEKIELLDDKERAAFCKILERLANPLVYMDPTDIEPLKVGPGMPLHKKATTENK